jgi:hypothetical protein
MVFGFFFQCIWQMCDLMINQINELCRNYEQFQQDARVGALIQAISDAKAIARRIAVE